jgi:prophage regulatory protein
MQPKIILRLNAVQARTGLSRSSIYRFEAEGKFPQRVRLGENSTGWFADEIDEYLANRPRVSDTPKAA